MLKINHSMSLNGEQQQTIRKELVRKWINVQTVKSKNKTPKQPYLMRIDNRKVNTISASDVGYLLCEHWETI